MKKMFEFTNDYLRNCRLEKGLSQVECAKKLNCSSQFIANWERNVSFCPLSKLAEYCDLIGACKGTLMRQYLRDQKEMLIKVLKPKHIRLPDIIG